MIDIKIIILIFFGLVVLAGLWALLSSILNHNNKMTPQEIKEKQREKQEQLKEEYENKKALSKEKRENKQLAKKELEEQKKRDKEIEKSIKDNKPKKDFFSWLKPKKEQRPPSLSKQPSDILFNNEELNNEEKEIKEQMTVIIEKLEKL